MSKLNLEIVKAGIDNRYNVRYFGKPGMSRNEAEEILRRCNCHDELVAACEKGLEICDTIDGLLATDEEIEAVVEAMKWPIQAALAKAKEIK